MADEFFMRLAGGPFDEKVFPREPAEARILLQYETGGVSCWHVYRATNIYNPLDGMWRAEYEGMSMTQDGPTISPLEEASDH